MMSRDDPPQNSLFYYHFNLEQRIPADHPLRAVARLLDFDFIYDEVEHHYGANGHASVPPAVILKLMFLLVFENVPSERQLMATLPYRLDWLWFLRMDLDSSIPNHSVLSKARKRWGAAAFRRFFTAVLQKAAELGLIDGSKIFCDGSLFDANASKKSVIDVQVVELERAADELESRLAEDADESDDHQDPGGAKPRSTKRSTTDPDAAVVTKPGAGSPRPRYKAHRAIDSRHGVITATITTAGDVDEATELLPLIEQHEQLLRTKVCVAVADTQYGTSENYLACGERGIEPHMRALQTTTQERQKTRGLYALADFTYDENLDVYRCPAGQILRTWQQRPDRNAVRYAAGKKTCSQCPQRALCTSSAFRTVTRHVRESELSRLRALAHTDAGRLDLRTRKHLMERSFAVGVRYGLKRCRWRRLWRAEIHELLVATVQNIATLLRNRGPRSLASPLVAVRKLFIQLRELAGIPVLANLAVQSSL